MIGDLSTAEICSIDNFDVAALTANGFNYAVCTPTKKNPKMLQVAQAPVPPEKNLPTPPVKYDVVGKTIAQLRADMESGVTTSEKITQAYLDRIAAYDTGQFGFHSYEIVATNAIDQARAADAARKKGATGALLGIPIVVKNLYDTFDMATTNGSMTFAGFHPGTRRLPDSPAPPGGRGHHRQGRSGGIRHQWQLLERRIRTSVERVQSVEVVDRVERRPGQRLGGEPGGGRNGIADR